MRIYIERQEAALDNERTGGPLPSSDCTSPGVTLTVNLRCIIIKVE